MSDAAVAALPGELVNAARASRQWSGWKLPATLLGVGIVALLWMFWPTAWSMVRTWMSSNAFGHGFLIVPIALYLVWARRRELAARQARPSLWGVALAGVAAFTWLLGDLADASVVRQLALVAMLQAFTFAVLGWRATRILLFPLLYLYFAVPLGVALIPPLQDFTAAFVVRFLRFTGVPVFLDGVFIQIPNGNFEVAEACAGLRFLIASLALGTLFSNVMYRQLWRRVLFIALSIVVPIFANGFRAYGIVLLAYLTDVETAAGADHVIYGLIFLSIVLITLLCLGMTFRERPAYSDSSLVADIPAASGNLSARFLATFVMALALTGGVSAYSGFIAREAQANPGTPLALAPPAPRAHWEPAPRGEESWRPVFAMAGGEVLQSYEGPLGRVDFYLAFYPRQGRDAEAINANNTVVGEEPWQRAGGGHAEATVDGRPLRVARTRIVGQGRRRLVWHWYWVDGEFTSNPYIGKLLGAKAKLLTGYSSAAVIVVAADYVDSPQEAERALRDFLANLSGLGDTLSRAAP